MNIGRFVLFGTKDTQTDPDTVEPRAVGVAPSGAMKVWIDGVRNTFNLAITAVVSTLPNVTIASIPAVNPTKPTPLAHGLLGATGAVLFTSAAAYREVEIRFANVDTVARTYTYALNAATPGAVDDTHTQAKTSPLPVGYAAVERVPGLINGDVILGLCDSANKVSYTIWGVA